MGLERLTSGVIPKSNGPCIWRSLVKLSSPSQMLLLAFKTLTQENLQSVASSISGSDQGSTRSHWCHVDVDRKPYKDISLLLTSGPHAVYCQRVGDLESSNSKVEKDMWLHSQETLRSLHGPKIQRGSRNVKNERSFLMTSKKPAEFCCAVKSGPCAHMSGVPHSRTAPSPTIIQPSLPPRRGTGLGVPEINHAWQEIWNTQSGEERETRKQPPWLGPVVSAKIQTKLRMHTF